MAGMLLPELPPELQPYGALIGSSALPAIGFSLKEGGGEVPGGSRLGGTPDLSPEFAWPAYRQGRRSLDFLLQIDFRDLRPFDCAKVLPSDGLLSFFYDVDEQPWGYDPKEIDGFRVVYTPASRTLCRASRKSPLNAFSLVFHETLTLPRYRSRAYTSLEREVAFSDKAKDVYLNLTCDPPWRGPKVPAHHLLGHADNIQGDMQLQAQLVTNGLYCGDSSGYEDPRRKLLEPGADDWILLLQLDTDMKANFMWGDCGMLYYWIRRQDLTARNFSQVWMTLQC